MLDRKVRESQLTRNLERKCWMGDQEISAKGWSRILQSGSTLRSYKRGLRQELTKETHASKWAGLLGQATSLALLSQSYFWSKVEDDVEAYVRFCLMRQKDKIERMKEAGMVAGAVAHSNKPLKSYSMDFITGFPKFARWVPSWWWWIDFPNMLFLCQPRKNTRHTW